MANALELDINIGEAAHKSSPAYGGALLMLDPRALIPDSRNERGEITAETDPDLEGLVESIQANGVLEPLRVYNLTDVGYVISSGHRRRAAAILAGRQEVPCYLVDIPDGATRDIERLVANFHRKDIDPISKARTIKLLLEEAGLRQTALAERLGIAQPTLANLTRLLRLPEEIQQYIAQGRLSAGHGHALLRIEEPVIRSDWRNGQYVFWDVPVQDYILERARVWLPSDAYPTGTSIRNAEGDITQVLDNNKYNKRRQQEQIKEAARGSDRPIQTVEDLQEVQHEERRKRSAEGRARTARVRTAYATMVPLVKLPEEGAPSLEHLKLAALAVKMMSTYYDDPKIWEAAWGIDDSKWDTKAYQEALEACTTPEAVLRLMCQQALFVVSVDGTGDRMGYGSVSQYADKLFGIVPAIKKALEAQKGGAE